MKQINLWLLVVFLILSIATEAQKKATGKKPVATKSSAQQKPDVAADEKKVRDIVAFLEYMLNTLGSSSTPIRDKEVLITESYSKIFRDSKVQVEDDLDENRKVITNKDVVAYLKDVNFFFTNVRFEFTIEDIKGSTLPDGQHFYKVTTQRNLKGTTSDQKPVNNTSPRYIEINYDPKNQDLKIVSIYTNEFDETRALTNWWKELSYEWQSIFRKKLNLSDSVQLRDIKRITSLTELDLSGNTFIQELGPLDQLNNLRSLTISKTAVADLTPIRNLTELTELDVSHSRIQDLSPLKYSSKLEVLNIAHTNVTHITVVEKMTGLQRLIMNNTSVRDFSPLEGLTQLQIMDLGHTKISTLSPVEHLIQLTELNLSGTPVQELTSLSQLENLTMLDLDSTTIHSLVPLSGLTNLKIISANYTAVADLSPLAKLPQLEKIYCDQTPIKREAAEAFMTANPDVLVIFDSKDLQVWWSAMSPDWQQVFIGAAKIGATPSKEELAKIPLLDSINLNGNPSIQNLEPLRRLQKLKKLNIQNTRVSDLSPLRDNPEIHYLNISQTDVEDLTLLNQLKRIKVVYADDTKVVNIDGIHAPSLEQLYVDGTAIPDAAAKKFLERNPTCLLVFKTPQLKAWWNTLPEPWLSVFKKQMGNSIVTRDQLHALVELESLTFSNTPISDLTPLLEFIRLTELHFSGTAMTSIAPVEALVSLRSLHATNSPIQSIESLSILTELEELDISNTPVDDVYELWRLKKLIRLNCAGTQIKRLDALEKMENLEYFDCSNTNVNKLSALDYLPLKTLTCYNTKIPNRIIENFKASHPECKVVYYR